MAIKTQVVLLSGGEKQIRGKVESRLTDVLNGINKNYETNTSLDPIRHNFTPAAYIEFYELAQETKLYATQRECRTYLISTENGFFEVRNLKVRIFLGDTPGIPFQNLVFVINNEGLIENVHFAIEDHHYQAILDQGQQLEDLAYREKILHFIELYRTAYNKKDLEFIEKTLSDDALIIVGYVVKTKKQEVDYLEKSYLSDEQIQFIRLGKYEYLKRLEKVFQQNDFVRIQFDQITIQRHPQLQRIYGVQLKQRWNSSEYSDEGYLFLMVDFIQPQEPIIHVRAWQPDKFSDGSTINIYDFEIVE
jgi:hypothetical protein